MRGNSKMEATTNRVGLLGRMEIAMREDGRREGWKEEDCLNIMKASF
jgi:hypothetical protein